MKMPYAAYDATGRLLCDPSSFAPSTLEVARVVLETDDRSVRQLEYGEPDQDDMFWSVYCLERDVGSMCLGDFTTRAEALLFYSRMLDVMGGSQWSREVSCCLWEELLNLRNTNAVVRDAFEGVGCSAMRLFACDLAEACEKDWLAVASAFDGCFDWDFVPRWIAENVEWTEDGGRLRVR